MRSRKVDGSGGMGLPAVEGSWGVRVRQSTLAAAAFSPRSPAAPAAWPLIAGLRAARDPEALHPQGWWIPTLEEEGEDAHRVGQVDRAVAVDVGNLEVAGTRAR